jgi:hypothetical protein
MQGAHFINQRKALSRSMSVFGERVASGDHRKAFKFSWPVGAPVLECIISVEAIFKSQLSPKSHSNSRCRIPKDQIPPFSIFHFRSNCLVQEHCLEPTNLLQTRAYLLVFSTSPGGYYGLVVLAFGTLSLNQPRTLVFYTLHVKSGSLSPQIKSWGYGERQSRCLVST